MKFVWGAVFALGLAGAALADDDDDTAPVVLPAKLSYEDLENRVRLLEEHFRQDPEMEKLKKAAAAEKQAETQGLPDRVSKLEKGQAAAGQTWDASKMLTFSTPDGNFTAKIGGRIYLIYRHIFDRGDQNAAPRPDGFDMDTARFQLDGTFYKDFFYRVEGEAQSQAQTGQFKLKDVYLGWNIVPDYLTVQAGQMKTPWSQEETCSSRFIDFAERSILNRLAPAHDIGLLFKGTVADKIVEWNLGVMNSAPGRDQGRNAPDVQDEKELVFRLFVTPFKTLKNPWLEQLRIGFDLTYQDLDNRTVASLASAGGVSTGDLGSAIVNPLTLGGTPVDGIQKRYLFNLSYLYGPASLRAEYATVDTEVLPAAGFNDSFQMKMYYVQATFILTGETKPLENRIKPNHNLDPLAGGWGAVELAVRYAFLDTSDGVDANIMAATANAKTKELTIGVNWWWTPNMALRLNYEHFTFDQDLPLSGGTPAEQLTGKHDMIYLRWQIDF